jgi:hypothetical protein
VVYQWKGSARISIPAQAAGDRIESLREANGGVTPALVVRDAKKKRSPLHDAFEWDDGAAAKAHRLTQASYLLRSLTVTVVAGVTRAPIRAVVHIITDGEQRYQSIDVALSDPGMRSQVLARALAELRAWQSRYSELKELARVFKAIDAV